LDIAVSDVNPDRLIRFPLNNNPVPTRKLEHARKSAAKKWIKDGSGPLPIGWITTVADASLVSTFLWGTGIAEDGSRSIGLGYYPTLDSVIDNWVTADFIPIDPTKEDEFSGYIYWNDWPGGLEDGLIWIHTYDAMGVHTIPYLFSTYNLSIPFPDKTRLYFSFSINNSGHNP